LIRIPFVLAHQTVDAKKNAPAGADAFSIIVPAVVPG